MDEMRPLSLAEQMASLSPPEKARLRGESAPLTADDKLRLAHQAKGVRDAVLKKGWLTLQDIENATGYPQASISARLRDLRRRGMVVDKRRRTPGTWEYRVWQPAP